MSDLTPEQRRNADKAMEAVLEEITEDGWEVPAKLQEAVYDAFFKGVGYWQSLVIRVEWNHDGPVR